MSTQWNIWMLQHQLAEMDHDDDKDDDIYEEAEYDLADMDAYHPVSGRWN